MRIPVDYIFAVHILFGLVSRFQHIVCEFAREARHVRVQSWYNIKHSSYDIVIGEGPLRESVCSLS